MTSTRPLLGALVLALALTGATAAFADKPDPNYWRLDDILSRFETWETAYPDLFLLKTLGISGEGEPIPMAHVSAGVATESTKPRLLLNAAQHSNECNGTGALMALTEKLLAGYGTNPTTTAWLDSLDLWIVPIVNVDGHRLVFDGHAEWREWRKTLRDNNGNGAVDFPDDGVDLNRNWDWNWEAYEGASPSSLKYKGPAPWSEPEDVALRDFVLAERPLLVVDLHSPSPDHFPDTCVLWPIQGSGGYGPDEEISRDIAQDWAANTQTLHGGDYSVWWSYDTLPKQQCWIYGRTGILAYLIEIEDDFWFTGDEVTTIADNVAEGLYTLLDRAVAGPGLRGLVTDAHTGQPLQAEVRIQEYHSSGYGPYLSEERLGRYHRLLPTPGETVTVNVLCDGYLTFGRDVTIASTGWTTSDFALEPDPTAADSTDDAAVIWLRAANPLTPGGTVRLALPSNRGPAQVELFSVTGRRLAVLGRDLAGGCLHEMPFPADLPAGVYLARARTEGEQQVKRLTWLR